MRPCDHCDEVIGPGDEICVACGRRQTWADQLHRRRDRISDEAGWHDEPDPDLIREARREMLQSLLFTLVVSLVCGAGGWAAAGWPGAVIAGAAAGLILLTLPLSAAL